jgi:hypothetical protein
MVGNLQHFIPLTGSRIGPDGATHSIYNDRPELDKLHLCGFKATPHFLRHTGKVIVTGLNIHIGLLGSLGQSLPHREHRCQPKITPAIVRRIVAQHYNWKYPQRSAGD